MNTPLSICVIILIHFIHMHRTCSKTNLLVNINFFKERIIKIHFTHVDLYKILILDIT